jgi:hypothetical protein
VQFKGTNKNCKVSKSSFLPPRFNQHKFLPQREIHPVATAKTNISAFAVKQISQIFLFKKQKLAQQRFSNFIKAQLSIIIRGK